MTVIVKESLLNTVKNSSKDKEVQKKVTANIKTIVQGLNNFFSFYSINQNSKRVAAFLAQVAQETGGFLWIREMQWLPETKAKPKLKKLYWDNVGVRNSLGNKQVSDSWNYRGRGLLQLTGRYNYSKMEAVLETKKPDNFKAVLDLIDHPYLAENVYNSCLIGCAFWDFKGLNIYADLEDISEITRRITGGSTALEQRKKYYRTLLDTLSSPSYNKTDAAVSLQIPHDELPFSEDPTHFSINQEFTFSIDFIETQEENSKYGRELRRLKHILPKIKTQLSQEEIRFYLIQFIELQLYKRTFFIEGEDADQNSINEKISNLSSFLFEDEIDCDEFGLRYQMLNDYLNREDVLMHYVDSLIKMNELDEELIFFLSSFMQDKISLPIGGKLLLWSKEVSPSEEKTSNVLDETIVLEKTDKERSESTI